MRAWEQQAGFLPWEHQQPVWDDLIEIRRLKSVAGLASDQIGNVGYSGSEQSTSSVEGEIVLYTNLQAQISAKSAGAARGGLPTDIVSKPTWQISIAPGQVLDFGIRDRDICIDRQGYRYQVGQNYMTPLGWQLNCIRLEA